jgi:hypothetical protein
VGLISERVGGGLAGRDSLREPKLLQGMLEDLIDSSQYHEVNSRTLQEILDGEGGIYLPIEYYHYPKIYLSTMKTPYNRQTD